MENTKEQQVGFEHYPSWAALAQVIQEQYPNQPLLVLVHVAYAREDGGPNYKAYEDTLWEITQKHNGPIILIRHNDKDLYMLPQDKFYHIIHNFSDVEIEKPFHQILLAGSTLQGPNDESPGCVNLVAQRLEENNFVAPNDIQIVSDACLILKR